MFRKIRMMHHLLRMVRKRGALLLLLLPKGMVVVSLAMGRLLIISVARRLLRGGALRKMTVMTIRTAARRRSLKLSLKATPPATRRTRAMTRATRTIVMTVTAATMAAEGAEVAAKGSWLPPRLSAKLKEEAERGRRRHELARRQAALLSPIRKRLRQILINQLTLRSFSINNDRRRRAISADVRGKPLPSRGGGPLPHQRPRQPPTVTAAGLAAPPPSVRLIMTLFLLRSIG